MARSRKQRLQETKENKLGDFLYRHEIALVFSIASIIIVLLDLQIYFGLLFFFDDYEISSILNTVDPRFRDTFFTMKTGILLLADLILFVALCPWLSKLLHKIIAKTKNAV